MFIATGVGLGVAGAVGGTVAAGIAAGVATAGALTAIGGTLYGIASKPGAPGPTSGGINVNQMETVIASYGKEKDRLAKLKAQLAKAQTSVDGRPVDTQLISSLTAKIAASEQAVADWRNEINQIQINAGLKPVPTPAAPPGAFVAPTTGAAYGSSGGWGGGSGGGSGGGAGFAPAGPPSVAAGASPKMIIGLALLAAVGGGAYLSTLKKHKK